VTVLSIEHQLLTSEYFCSWKDKVIDVTLSVAGIMKSIGFYNVADANTCKKCGNPKLFSFFNEKCLEEYLHSRLAYADGVFQVGYYYNKNSYPRKDPNDLLNKHIWGLKTRGEFANPLAQAMLLVMERNFQYLFEADAIVPVPNHKEDPNQNLKAVALALELEKILKNKGNKINLKSPILKLKNSKVQQLDRPSREKAVEGMFGFDNSLSIEGDKVILVDDVLTAANVKGECAKILKEQGAAKVWIMTAGRTT